MAIFCLGWGMQPSEYLTLTQRQREVFKEAMHEINDQRK